MTFDFYDLIQEKVWSQGKRDNLLAIFESEDPGHYDKLYFCGFLLNVLKLSLDNVIQIILEESAWLKKNPKMTFLQVRSVLHSIKQHNRFSSGSVISDSALFLTVFENFEINENNEKSNATNTVKQRVNIEIKTKIINKCSTCAYHYNPVLKQKRIHPDDNYNFKGNCYGCIQYLPLPSFNYRVKEVIK